MAKTEETMYTKHSRNITIMQQKTNAARLAHEPIQQLFESIGTGIHNSSCNENSI